MSAFDIAYDFINQKYKVSMLGGGREHKQPNEYAAACVFNGDRIKFKYLMTED